MMRPSAFTLVELLIVIGIIVILLLALLPALNYSTDCGGRQSTCQNNQRQIATAISTFEAANNRYLGYTNAASSNGIRRRLPWTIAIFPYLDNNALYEDYVQGTEPLPAVELAMYMCPSDPPAQRGLPRNSYIINAGRADVDAAANGIAHDRFSGQVLTSAALVKSGDGLSNTLACSENLLAAAWNEGYFLGQGVDPGPGKERHSMVWHVTAKPLHRINSRGATTLDLDTARPSSRHAGGAIVAFLDGHVIFLREDIDRKVYVQLLTTDHPRSSAPDKTYRLNTADYQ